MNIQTPNAESIFGAAIEIETSADRAEYLEDACKNDPQLRQAIEKLVNDHFAAGDFLIRPVEGFTIAADIGAAEICGSQIGPYKLLEVIGEGGMGTVYMAQQTEPVSRRVALKLIKSGMDTRQVIARFEAERQALALMDHPSIAKVLDAGATESGRPYFVMELVKGQPITKFCDDQQLDVESRLKLFQDVCHGVQHAHQKGIIHRDLKPSNVLVAMYDERPVPKVIDFGVSKAVADKLTEKTVFTRFGQIVGTLEYMSPEQAQFNNLDIDTRSDIYSLGAILYELLAGEPPFERERIKSQALDETLRMIREGEPTKPSTKLGVTAEAALVASRRQTSPANLGSLLRGDLDWIVMKSLAKLRSRRYESASAFADDIQRHLDNEAVLAGPPSVAYRFRKFATRNRSLFVGSMVAAVGLITATIVSTYLYLDAQQARGEAIAEANRKTLAESIARREATTANVVNEFVNVDLLGAANPEIEPNRNLRVRDVLDRAAEHLDTRFEDEPLVEAAIRRTIGKGYRSLGIQPAALQQLEQSVALYRQHLGDLDKDTLMTELDLMLVIHDQQHYQQVRLELERIQSTCHEQFGDDAPITLRSRWQLAEILSHLGEHGKAVEICEHDLPICLDVLPDHHETTLSMIATLAGAERSLGNKKKAEESLLALIPRVDAAFGGDDNPAMIRVLRNLAITVALQHRYAEAERWYSRVLTLQQNVFSKNHPDTFETRLNIATSRYLHGDRDAAFALFRSIADEQAQILGDDDPRTLNTRQRLAVLVSQHSGPEDAIREYELLVPQIRLTLDPEHPNRTSVIDWYGKMLQQVGRDDAFQDLLLQELESQNRVLGPDHIATRRTVAAMRKMLEQSDDPNIATEVLQQQIDILKKDRIQIDPFNRASLLARYYGQSGLVFAQYDRLEEAISFWSEEDHWRQTASQLKPDNLENLAAWGGCLSNLATVTRNASEDPLSIPELEQYQARLESAERKLTMVLTEDPTHLLANQHLRIVMQNLAETCVDLSRFELAADYFQSLAERTSGSDRILNLRHQVNALIRADRLDAVFEVLESGFDNLELTDDDRLFMAGAYARCLARSRAEDSGKPVQRPFRQQAMTILRDLVAEPKQLSDGIITKLRSDDDFRSLRADEAFISLLAKLPKESDINSNKGAPKPKLSSQKKTGG